MVVPPGDVTTAVMPKFLATLSFLGSSYIVFDFVRNSANDCVRPIRRAVLRLNRDASNKSGNSTYKRLIFAMSCIDMCTSLAYFLGTWPIPDGSGPYMASGTLATCRAQGFFIQTGIAIPCYNLSLSAYYLLVVARGWKRHQIVAVEPYLHALPLLVGLGTGVASVCLGILDDATFWCWISHDDDGFRMAFTYVPVWCCLFGVMVAMFETTRAVFVTEGRSDRWGSKNERVLGKQVASQALCFVGAMCLTDVFSSASRVAQMLTGEIPYWLAVLMAATLPGQGLWNFLVYCRPRYLRYRKERQRREARKKREVKKENPGSRTRVVVTPVANIDVENPSLRRRGSLEAMALPARQDDHEGGGGGSKKGETHDGDETHTTTGSSPPAVHETRDVDGAEEDGWGDGEDEEDDAAHEILDDPATAMMSVPDV